VKALVLLAAMAGCGCPEAQRVPADFSVYNGGADTVEVRVNGHTLVLPPWSGVWWEDPEAWGFGWTEGQRWQLVPAPEEPDSLPPGVPTIGWDKDWRPK